MITTEHKTWLGSICSSMVPATNGVVGITSFRATYNATQNQFAVLFDGEANEIGGVELSGAYKISIEERTVPWYSQLPAVFVYDVELIPERHFGPDKSACLCSPLEEEEFLRPTFNFQRFFFELVIPFLYGQTYYSQNHRWPWKQYAHYAAGLLESFNDFGTDDVPQVRQFLSLLPRDRAWPQIRELLLRKNVKGHTPCVCPVHDQIRRCHPKALAGLRRLHAIVRAESISLPRSSAAKSAGPNPATLGRL